MACAFARCAAAQNAAIKTDVIAAVTTIRLGSNTEKDTAACRVLSILLFAERGINLMYGYIGKLLFVDLSTGKIEVRDLKESDARNFVGGPALGAKILYEEMPANADPLGEESMIGFVGGPLNDTKALYGGRYTVVHKSPVSQTWNDANSGGAFGPFMKKAGFDAVFVKGIAKKPVYIFIDNGKAEIVDAEDVWGLPTITTEKVLREKYGDKVNAALIGPAGENKALVACVMNDDHRAAGRGGCGAVMGSKLLKAIVVRGDQKAKIFDEARVLENNKKVLDWMKGPAKGTVDQFGEYGTGGGYVESVITNDASIKNWTGHADVDHPEDVAYKVGSLGIDYTKTRKYACHTCPLGCGAFHDFPSDKWDLKNSPRPEYETMGAFGSQLCNGDPASVFQCNNLCNEYGTDTISTGAVIGWAMECYDKGILSKEELDGIDLKWGDVDAIVALTEKICKGEGVGKILMQGSQWAADHWGKGHECLVVANGIEEPQHDSRLVYGIMRCYQYDPTPGRHIKGSMGFIKHMSGHDIDYRGTGYQDIHGTSRREVTNASGYCLFGEITSPMDMPIDQIEAVTGFTYSPPERLALGLRMYMMRHAFNVREGLRRKDYKVSPRFYESGPPHAGPIAGIKVDNELLADNFFNAMGLDLDTVPLKESLINLGGLELVIKDLYPEE